MESKTIASRRSFVTTSGTAAAVFVLPGCAADSAPSSPNVVNDEWESTAAELEATGQGIYTAEDEMDLPGKASTHVPRVEVAGKNVTVSTPHVMSVEANHFIQYHYVRGQTGVIVAMQEYELGTDLAATMTFTVPEGTTEFTVYQYCNLHWTWSPAEQSATT